MSDNIQKYRIPIYLIILHIVLGLLCFVNPNVANIWCVVVIILGLYYTAKNKNKNNEAAIWSAYMAGLGVLFKVCRLRFGYDIDKYVIVLFLFIGLFYNGHQKRKSIWLLAIVLLFPSLLVSNISNSSFAEQFELIRFSIMGIIVLLVSAFYFDGRMISKQRYLVILASVILPIISTIILISLRAPDFSEISFRSASMEELTGGFSPVHVSLVLGLALLILLLLTFLKEGLIINTNGNYFLIAAIILRILYGFSRSGLWSFIISFAISLFFLRKIQSGRKRSFIVPIAVLAVISMFIWNYVNDSTGGMAYNRFTGRNSIGEELDANGITSNRIELLDQDLTIFVNSPILGVGPGNVSDIRFKQFGANVSSHTEYSRLLCEHGVFGLVVVFILFIKPVNNYKQTKGLTRLFFMAFCSYSLISMFPGATRTSLPMLFYGFSFIKIYEDYYIEPLL